MGGLSHLLGTPFPKHTDGPAAGWPAAACQEQNSLGQKFGGHSPSVSVNICLEEMVGRERGMVGP